MNAPQQRRRSDEEDNQVALFKWADLELRRHPELRWMFAIPNGGARDVVTGARLKAAGVRAGVWDIFLPVSRGRWHGLWIEMKAGDNKLTDNQREFGIFVGQQGYQTHVCYDWSDARSVILTYLRAT